MGTAPLSGVCSSVESGLCPPCAQDRAWRGLGVCWMNGCVVCAQWLEQKPKQNLCTGDGCHGGGAGVVERLAGARTGGGSVAGGRGPE